MRTFSSAWSRVLRALVAVCFVTTLLPLGGATAASTSGGTDGSRYARAYKEAAGGLRVPMRRPAPTRLNVQWRPGTPASQIDAAAAQVGFRVVRTSDRLGWSLVEPADEGVSPEKLAEKLKKARLTVRAEVERAYQPSTVGIPNDPRFGELWGLHNTGQTGGTPDADIDAPEAWESFGVGSKDVVVAVIDTGVDHTHADLKANRWVNTREIPNNGRDDDGNGFVDDYYGYDFYNWDSTPYDQFDGDQHGTHVAGTIGAVGDNGTGVAGVNWNVTIMPVKFLGPYGGWDFDGAEAIVYAVDNGADVINASWGGGYSEILEDAIQYAADNGVLFVAAAGNWGEDVDVWPEYNYPASSECTNVVTVAATDHDDQLTSWSNYGATSVEVAAPGEDILSTLPYDTCALYINSPPYRLAYLALAPEAIEPTATSEAIITRSVTQVGAVSTTPILVVDDSMPTMTEETAGERLDVYLDALAGAGFTNVTTWSTEDQGTPSYNTLRNKVVVWFTGATAWGWYDDPTLTYAERSVIGQFLDNGGRMVMASGELATDMTVFGADWEWFEQYFKSWAYDYWSWGYTFKGAAGTPYAGLEGSLPAAYQTPGEKPWPTGVDTIIPIDETAKPMMSVGGYGLLSGTSMAAPHVTGALALLKSSFPDADAAELKARIENTADYLPGLDGAVAYSGRINVDAAHRTYPGRPAITAPKTGEVVYGGTDGVIAWNPATGGDPDAEFEVEQGLPVGTDSFDFESGDLAGFETLWDFEWTVTSDPAEVFSGDYSARTALMSADTWGEQSIVTTVTLDTPGVMEFWGRHDTGMWISVPAVFVNDRAVWYTFDPFDWSRITVDLPAGENRVEFYFFNDQGDAGPNAFFIDDIQVYEYEFTPVGTAPAGSTEILWPVPAVDTDMARVRVRAVGDSAVSAWATAKGFRITTDTEAPAMPTDFEAVAGSDGDATLSWTDPGDADFAATRIVRTTGEEPTGPNDPAGTVVYEGTAESYYDSGLAHGETYHYAAYARDDNMNWSEGAHDSVVAHDVTPPEQPGMFSAHVWEWTVALTWTPPEPGTYEGVKVLRRTDAPPAGPDDPEATLVYDGTGAWAADWDLTAEPIETHAYYGAWAYDASGNTSDGVFDDLFVDTAPPDGEFMLNGGDEHTTNPTVRADSLVTGATEMRFHVNGEIDESEPWQPFAAAAWLDLLPIDGWQSVTGQFRDESGNVTSLWAEIYVNLDAPPAPAGLAAAVWGGAVKLSWDDPWGEDWDDWEDWGEWALPWWFSPLGGWDPYPDNESFDVVGWNVFVAEDEAGPYTKHNTFLVQWPQYMVGGLQKGEEYWFKVQAVDIVGWESELSEAVSAIPGEGVVRHAGPDRYATAVEISTATWESAETVVLATGGGFADALGAASLAGCYDAPVLLTRQNRLPQSVADEIERLGASTVVIVGGEAAVGPAVEDLLAESYDVQRIAGINRYETAALVAIEVATLNGDFDGTVFIASGESFPDALAISPYAFNTKTPILLVHPRSVRPETLDAIDAIGAYGGWVVGGTAVVPDAIADSLGIYTARIDGRNRYETALNAAERAYWYEWGDFSTVGMATGVDFADALAGGAATGREGGVMLLTRPDYLPDPTMIALELYHGEMGRINVFGGPSAVSEFVYSVLQMMMDGTYWLVTPNEVRGQPLVAP